MIIIMFLVHVYFTSLPYYIYNKANKNGNMAYAGIGLGLIQAQQMFWIANMGVLVISLNNHLRELSFILAPFLCYMYLFSVIKIYYLTHIIPIKHI